MIYIKSISLKNSKIEDSINVKLALGWAKASMLSHIMINTDRLLG
jgi:hypothetical protein